MFSISDFLGKYNNQLAKSGLFNERIKEVIKEETGLELPSKELVVKNNRLHINSSAKVKLEIFLKKDWILEKINNGVDRSNAVVDIK